VEVKREAVKYKNKKMEHFPLGQAKGEGNYYCFRIVFATKSYDNCFMLRRAPLEKLKV